MSKMQCGNCRKNIATDNFAVIKNNHYCLNCLATNPSLFNDKQSSYTNQTKLSTKQCQVCLDEKEEQDFNTKYNNRCRHTQRSICDNCLYQHIQQAFGKMCTDDVHCPELNCRITFEYETIQKILSNNKDRKLLEKYDEFVFQRQLEKMNEFIWCAHGCGMGQLNIGEDENNIVECIKCHKKTCFTHKTEWHKGMTCQQYDGIKSPDHRATQSWIAQNCKKCPKCSTRIEKADGCDHMTCTHCRYEFCWSCLADYNAIRKDGNHRHESRCKHYAAYHKH